jgi:parallel beta-helix repeat protein
MGALALVALTTLFLFGSPGAPANAQEISIDDANNTLTVDDVVQGDSVIVRGALKNVSANDYPSALTAVLFKGDIEADDMDLSWWAGATGWQAAGPAFATNYPGYQMEMEVGGAGFALPPHYAGAGTWIKAVAKRDFDTVEIKVITYVDATGNQQYDLNEAIISELAAVIDHDIRIDLLATTLDEVYVDDGWEHCVVGDPASDVPVQEVADGKFCQINAFATIQEAIDAVTPGGTVDVYPGDYLTDEANDRDPDTGGAGSNDFNIFVGKAVTIRGVDDAGDPIADYGEVAARVVAARELPTFGQSAIFVQADGVTITGLDVTGWSGTENNKTVEVVGNGFTIKYCALHGMDSAAALYFDDRHFNAVEMTSRVQSYHIEENLIDGGGIWPTGIRFSNGAGWSGPVSDRVIKDNDFQDNCDAIAFVGPQADPWDVYPVGAATITDNRFVRSDRRHVIAWGKYGDVLGYRNLDWQAIVENNDFDKGAITWTPGGDAQPWTLDPFFDVRGIYSTIQRYAINKAQNGDTVQVLPGLYPETLNIEGFGNLSIVGDDRDTVIVKPTSTLGWLIPGYPQYDPGRQAVVRVVGSTDIDISNITFDFDTVKGNDVYGVLYWNSTGTLDNNVLKNMSVPDASGGYSEITSYFRAPDLPYADAARASVTVKNSVFTDTGRVGILTHDFVNATIQGNTFTKTTDDFGYAIEMGSASTGKISANTISDFDTPALSDGSTVAGIYIENAFTNGLSGIVKPVEVSDNNNIYGNQYGVYIGNEWDGYAGDVDINVTLTGNNIHDNKDGGVYVADEDREYGSSVTLNASGNAVANNGDVGYWFNTDGDGELHATVSDETITGPGQADGVRIVDSACGASASLYDVTIGPDNDISGNDNGLFLDCVSGVVITGNEIHHNLNRSGYAGVGIDLWGDNDNNQILNNVIYENDRQGIFVGNCDFAGTDGECTTAGTPISTGNTIRGNVIHNNGRPTNPNPPDASAYGIQLWNADGNTIADNEIYGHVGWFPYPLDYPTYDFAQGIYLTDSNSNTVTGNNLHNNNYGVGVYGPSRGDGSNHINFNTIAGNTGYGVRNISGSAFVVDATNNWWGDVTGPSHLSTNPEGYNAGSGDKVSDYVLFNPWQTHGDQDMDGVPDAIDNCPTVYNPDQLNSSDGGGRPNGLRVPGDWASNPATDKLGDACDPDDDNDGLPDASEALCRPGPEFSCPPATCSCDLAVGTRPTATTCKLDRCDPLNPDTDGDTVVDGYEVANGSDPLNPLSKPTWEGGGDSDGDGLLDRWERGGYNTCAFVGDTFPGWSSCAVPQDSDGDGCSDTVEVLDLNGDRTVNSIDVGLMNKRVAGKIPADDPASERIFDVSKDGIVNSIDVAIMNKRNCQSMPGQLGCPVCPLE